MFEPVRAHETQPSPVVRCGRRPPAEAVLLAYCENPALRPADVLAVTDELALLPENTLAEEIRYGWPDPAGLLRGADWSPEYPGARVEVTNVFKDGVPLFYLHVSRFPAANEDVAGIAVVDEEGQPPAGDVQLLVAIAENNGEKRVYVYNNLAGEKRKYWLVYQALQTSPCTGSSRTVVEHREEIVPLPVGILAGAADATAQPGAPCAGVVCWPARGAGYNTQRLYVNDSVVPDTRVPVPFRYKIEAEVSKDGQTKTYYTPWRSGVVLHPASLLPWEEEEYVNGMKKLDDRLIADIIKPHIPTEELTDAGAVITYRVVTDNQFVQGSGRPDGLGYPYAYTTFDTGQVTALEDGAGQVWKYFAYDRETLAMTGLSGEERVVPLLFSLTAPDGTTTTREMVLGLDVGLSTHRVTITPDLFPSALPGAVLTVDLVDRVPGVDISLQVDGVEAFDSTGRWAVPWQAVEDGREVVLVVRETYRPGYFARTYAVRCVLSKPFTLATAAGGARDPWQIALTAGYILRPCPEQGDYWLYRLPPRGGFYREAPVILGPRTIKTGRAPLVVAAGTDGQPHNLTVMVNGQPVGVYCLSAEEGLLELGADIPPGSVLEVAYQAEEAWQLPWPGLDLNPRPGHCCLLADKYGLEQEVPAASLLGKTLYLYLRPAARLTALTAVAREVPEVAGRTEERLDLRLAHVPDRTRTNPVVYAAASGEVVPFGSGDTYWTWDAEDPQLIHIYAPNLPRDDLGNYLDSYAVDYYFVSPVLALVPESSRADVAFCTLEPSAEEGALLVGRITLDLPDLTPAVVDARRRGGGVREDLLSQAVTIEPEARHYWDIGYWDGEPWQRYGSGVVILPEDVLAGGGDARERVRQAIDRHKAWGTLLLERFAPRQLRYPDVPTGLTGKLTDEPEQGFAPPANLQASTIWEE